MDDDNIRQEFKLIIQTPDETRVWQARLERGEEVYQFDSPLELVAWLEQALASQQGGRGLR